VPLNTRTTYEETKPFAHALARLLEHEHPRQVVSDMKKVLRTGRVFVDWSQNDEHKTTVAVYSLRARERPTASTPVTWDEVERTFKKKDPNLLVFEAPQTVARFEKFGDLFEPVLQLKQKLPTIAALGGVATYEEPAAVPAKSAAKGERIEIAAQTGDQGSSRRSPKSATRRPAPRSGYAKARRRAL